MGSFDADYHRALPSRGWMIVCIWYRLGGGRSQEIVGRLKVQGRARSESWMNLR
jgi:hypothetical protein